MTALRAALLLIAIGLRARAAGPEFDVASVKVSQSAETGRDTGITYRLGWSGIFTATNAPLRFLITLAYGVKDFQISGGPAWLESERFDIDAKTDPISNPDQMLPMLRNLLENRFKLATHQGTKELPVFNLAPAKSGPKLQTAKAGSCYVPAPDVTPPPPPPGESDSLVCGRTYFLHPTQITGRKLRMSAFADGLSRRLERPVLDKSGLTGEYDIDLQWTPDEATDDLAFPIQTALQKQLGLSLQPGKAPVAMIVIDHVEKPSAN